MSDVDLAGVIMSVILGVIVSVIMVVIADVIVNDDDDGSGDGDVNDRGGIREEGVSFAARLSCASSSFAARVSFASSSSAPCAFWLPCTHEDANGDQNTHGLVRGNARAYEEYGHQGYVHAHEDAYVHEDARARAQAR